MKKFNRTGVAVLSLGALAALVGCGDVEVAAESEMPRPLIEPLPITVGVHYSEDFSKYQHAEERWGDPAWAASRVYLGFLAHVPDTLIERKFGERVAARVREEARPIESSLNETPSPEAMAAPLAAFDQALKERGLNPGTSADLTVATLFAATLTRLERPD